MIAALDQVYVINVKSFEERRRHVTAQLARFGLQGEFIHEWDIPELDAESDAWFNQPCALSPAQKSCGMKHLTALQRIAQRQQQSALVLEDDVILADEFPQAIERLPKARAEFSPLHVVFLGSGGNFYTPRSQRIPGQHLYRATKGRFGDSYLLNAQTARARLQWIESNHISKPIDNQFDIIDRELGIEILWYEDPVVEQGSKNGSFQSQIERDPPRWLKSIQFGWEKFRRKHLYQLWR